MVVGRRSRALVVAATSVVAVVLSACAPAPPADPLPPLPRSGTLRVVSWNVLGAQGDDRVYDEEAGWAARVGQLAADVVVLQEASLVDVSDIVDPAGPGYTSAAHVLWECDLKTEKEGVAVLVRNGVAVTGAGGTHVGDSCLDPSVRRILVWADVELGGTTVRVYGTHLTAGGGAAEQSRNEQIRRIRALIATHEAEGVGRWVLAGDLNFAIGSTSHRLMFQGEPGLPGPATVVDTQAEASPPSGSRATCPGVASTDTAGMAALWDDPALVRTCGYTAGWPKDDNWVGCELLSLCDSWEDRRDNSVRIRIDYVLRSGGLATGAVHVPNRTDTDWAVPGAEWYRLSDHLPVVADLDPVASAAGRSR